LSLPGLERMRDRTPDGLCPFCGTDPLAPSANGKARKTCGDEACETAYMRTYQRDRRAGNLVRTQRVESAAPAGEGHRANALRRKR